MRLKGKNALIIGAGSDIGRSIAKVFAKEGAKVGVNIYHNVIGGKNTIEEIEKFGGTALLLQADVCNSIEVEGMINKLIDAYDKIDILVNGSCVGTSQSSDRVTEILEEDWDKVIDVNLKGAQLTSKFSIPFMIKQGGGLIINISSIRGILGNPNLASYCASKGGMVLLTKEMALDYAQYNIRVNCICPGFIDTEMFRGYLQRQDDPEMARRVFSEMAPLNRIGKSEEIAYTALFFATEASSFITGVALPVDGGYTANGVRRIL